MNNSALIYNDNLLYLDAWMKHNESLRHHLKINGTDLVWDHDGMEEKISIENFYLPTLLYNLKFREEIQNDFKAEDFFKILRVHVLAQNLSFESSETNEVFINDFKKVYDALGNEVILFTDNFGHNFKIKNQVEKAFTIYHTLKNKYVSVKLEDFKKELEQQK